MKYQCAHQSKPPHIKANHRDAHPVEAVRLGTSYMREFNSPTPSPDIHLTQSPLLPACPPACLPACPTFKSSMMQPRPIRALFHTGDTDAHTIARTITECALAISASKDGLVYKLDGTKSCPLQEATVEMHTWIKSLANDNFIVIQETLEDIILHQQPYQYDTTMLMEQRSVPVEENRFNIMQRQHLVAAAQKLFE